MNSAEDFAKRSLAIERAVAKVYGPRLAKAAKVAFFLQLISDMSREALGERGAKAQKEIEVAHRVALEEFCEFANLQPFRVRDATAHYMQLRKDITK